MGCLCKGNSLALRRSPLRTLAIAPATPAPHQRSICLHILVPPITTLSATIVTLFDHLPARARIRHHSAHLCLFAPMIATLFGPLPISRSEEHTSELQSLRHL